MLRRRHPYHPRPLLLGGGDYAGCSLLFGQTQGSAPTVGSKTKLFVNEYPAL